jgi:hypothetical protein
MSMALFDALLQIHRGAGLILQLRVATEHRLRTRCVQLLSALIRIDNPNDVVAAHNNRGAEAVVDALEAYPRDAMVTQAALCALAHIWPIQAPWIPTQRIVKAVVDAAARHKTDRLIAQATMRLLKLHTQSTSQLELAPQVIDTANRIAGAFPDDDTIAHYAAETVVALATVEPADMIRTHGQATCLTMSSTMVALATNARQPATLVLGGQPWSQRVLALFPRLRSEA